MPKRIQRKRTRGWRMPPNTVYVGRPTKWGNHYKGNSVSWRAVDMFRRWVETYRDQNLDEFKIYIEPLRGKDLACWCPLTCECHADILLELANA